MVKIVFRINKFFLLWFILYLSGCGYAEWPPNRIEVIDENSPRPVKKKQLDRSSIRVRSGETIYSISRLYRIPMRSIIESSKVIGIVP